MSATEPALDKLLGAHLVKILVAHGVEAEELDGRVVLEPGALRWARLTATLQPGPAPIQMQIEASGPDGAVVADSWYGLGDDVAVALDNAVQHFCFGDFHVLLAGLWGVLEEDQVDHYTVATDNGEWDLYLGAWVSRASDAQNVMPAPEAAFAKAFIEAAPKVLNERRIHAVRVYVGALEGDLTYEALLDMEPNDELEAVLRSVPLSPPSTGISTQRLFFLTVPRNGRSAHTRVGRCTGPYAPALAPKLTVPVWMRVLLAVLLLVLVVLVMR